MPLIPIRLKPGINSVQTPTLNEASWASGSNIRFFQGLMQKDAGFVNLFSISDPIFDLHPWTALSATNYLGVGTQNTIQVWNGTSVTNITPAGFVNPSNRIFTLDNWGEFLMACPSLGPIYVWQPQVGGDAVAIGGQSPPSVGFIFISTQAQQLVACGMTNPATNIYDPMLIGWTDVGNYQTWTAGASNQAGTFRLAIGSKTEAALPLFGQNLIWTDTALYSMQYIQPPLVYGFQPLGINCGADGPHSVGILGGRIFWKSQNQFMTLGAGGTPEPLECPVWDQVFPNQHVPHLPTVCLTDTFYGEVSWIVVQQNGTYTKARLHVASNAWTVETYKDLTAWTDQSAFGAPIGGQFVGTVAQYDIGFDANGAAAPWSATTGIAMIAEGDQTTFVQDLIPDFATDSTNPAVSIMVYSYDYPNEPARAHGPFVVNSQVPVIHPRCRGRGIQFSFSGNDLGTFARLGNIRYRGNPDGKR